MTAPEPKPLVVWAVSDGRAGIENQALGLAEAVARRTPAEIVRKRLRFRAPYDRLPSGLKLSPRKFLTPDSDPVEPPWPDLWIGSGRASMPFSLRVRRWSKGATFVVQAQDPRWPPQHFDLVVPPKHDRVMGDNVFSLVGSPNRVTPGTLDAAREIWRPVFEPLPSPRVAVLIGGKSKAFDLSPERAATLAADVGAAIEQEGGSLMLTFSRRTPERAKAILTSRLQDLPGTIWDGRGDNPYFGMLAWADYVLVTEDSTNMATEAACTGAPVFVLKLDGQSLKFRRFHEELERRDVARPFGGNLYRWTYEPLLETDRAAEEILRRLRMREGSRGLFGG